MSLGRPIVLMRMRFARCPLENGTAPCQATQDCANTFFTCADRCNYECQTQEFWFTTNCDLTVIMPLMSRLNLPRYSPCITKCTHIPTKILPGQSFSRRSTWTICLEDKACASTPAIGDLIETQEYVQGSPVDIFIGDSTMNDLAQFIPIHGVMSTYSVSTSKGGCEYCLKIKDPLELSKNGVCPNKQLTDEDGNILALSLGIKLNGLDDEPDAQIGQNLLAFTILDNDNNYECLNSIEYLCVGDEIVKVRGRLDTQVTNRWLVELEERAVCGTELTEHDIGSDVAVPISFNHLHIVDVICRILSECMNLDDLASLCCEDEEPRRVIDFESFEQYRCDNPLFQIQDPVVICDQEDANDLLEGLAGPFLFSLTYDEDRIQISDARPPEPNNPAFIIYEDDIIKNTLSISVNDDYVTDAYINYDLIDWTQSVEPENTSGLAGNLSGDSLLPYCERRQHKQLKQSIQTTRWIGPRTAFLAKAQARRIRCQKENATHEICFDTLISNGRKLKLGDYGIVDHPKTRRWNGENNLWRLLSKQYVHNSNCMKLCFERSRYTINSLPFFSCDDTIPDVEDQCSNECYEVH